MFILTKKCKEHESSVISPLYGWSKWAFFQKQKWHIATPLHLFWESKFSKNEHC